MENKFVDGLFVNDKKNAPDFINAKLGITPKFIEYYNNNCDAKGNLRIDIKTAKSGKQYAEKDDWTPNITPNSTSNSYQAQQSTKKQFVFDQSNDKSGLDNIESVTNTESVSIDDIKREFGGEEINVEDVPF